MIPLKKNLLRLLKFLAAATLLQAPLPTLAIPKAAEHADAPVVSGAEAAIQKSSSKPARQQVRKNPVSTAKTASHKPANHPKKTKATRPKK